MNISVEKLNRRAKTFHIECFRDLLPFPFNREQTEPKTSRDGKSLCGKKEEKVLTSFRSLLINVVYGRIKMQLLLFSPYSHRLSEDLLSSSRQIQLSNLNHNGNVQRININFYYFLIPLMKVYFLSGKYTSDIFSVGKLF